MPERKRKPNRASAMKALNRFGNACFDRATMGGGDPDDYEIIEDEYEKATIAIEETIKALT